MMPMIGEADPNAQFETFIERCDRSILEKTCYLAFQQAQSAMAEVERLKAQLVNERGLPDRHREGVYVVKMMGGVKQADWQCSLDSIRLWADYPITYDDAILKFLEGMLE